MRTLLFAAALVACGALQSVALAEEKNPDKKHKEGQERTESLEIEYELDFNFEKRETRDCVVACFGKGAKKDVKLFAAMAVKLSAAFRKILPEAQREKPLPGPKITLYVIDSGKEEEQFLKAMAAEHKVKEEDLSIFRNSGSWNFFDKPIFIYVQRRTATAPEKSPDGELALHGLSHAFFQRKAESGYQSTPKWLTEGFAAFIEVQVKPNNPESCVAPAVRGSFDKRKDWDSQLKILATMGKDTPLVEIAAKKDYSDLSDERAAKAASVVGYLVKTYPEKFWKLANASFALGAEKAFKMVLGKELKTIEGDWRREILK